MTSMVRQNLNVTIMAESLSRVLVSDNSRVATEFPRCLTYILKSLL